MRVLIACEWSGTVRDAFIRAGHDALSCDIEPAHSPGPHYQGSVLDLLGEPFDLMIAHPPCTYLSYAGLAHWHKPGRAEKRQQAVDFATIMLYNSAIPRVCVENPKGYLTEGFRPANQYINPYQFGEPVRKHTGLWLKNLPPLKPTLLVPAPPPVLTQTGGVLHRGKLKARHHVDTATRRERTRFFIGIADAMAQQWGRLSHAPQTYTQSTLF